MTDFHIGVVEAKFADIIWENEPIASPDLVKKCENALNWKKSTMYTVLRRLCEKGIFKNENGIVSSQISRNDFYGKQSREYVAESFDGSLPAFLAAFTSGKKLNEKEIDEIQRMIDSFREEV